MQPCNEIYDFQIKTLRTTSLYFIFLSFLFIFNFFNLYLSKDPFKGASFNVNSVLYRPVQPEFFILVQKQGCFIRFKYWSHWVVLVVPEIYIGFRPVNSYWTETKFFNFSAQRWERERERERDLQLIRFQCRMFFNLHATEREI